MHVISHRCRECEIRDQSVLHLDIGYSVLDIGYSNYLIPNCFEAVQVRTNPQIATSFQPLAGFVLRTAFSEEAIFQPLPVPFLKVLGDMPNCFLKVFER